MRASDLPALDQFLALTDKRLLQVLFSSWGRDTELGNFLSEHPDLERLLITAFAYRQRIAWWNMRGMKAANALGAAHHLGIDFNRPLDGNHADNLAANGKQWLKRYKQIAAEIDHEEGELYRELKRFLLDQLPQQGGRPANCRR